MNVVTWACLLALIVGAKETPNCGDTHEITPAYVVLIEAEIPYGLWQEFLAVAWCESRLGLQPIGDGGASIGWWHIRESTWAQWAKREGYGHFNLRDPVDNARLTYLIGQHYDMPRYGERWRQWTSDPNWSACQAGVPPLLTRKNNN